MSICGLSQKFCVIACGILLFASCGGKSSPSSERQLNSALPTDCYESQSDKDTAVAAAQTEFDNASSDYEPGFALSENLAELESNYQDAVNVEDTAQETVDILKDAQDVLPASIAVLIPLEEDRKQEYDNLVADNSAAQSDIDAAKTSWQEAQDERIDQEQRLADAASELPGAETKLTEAEANTERLSADKESAQILVDTWTSALGFTHTEANENINSAEFALATAEQKQLCGIEDETNSYVCSYSFPEGSDNIDVPNHTLVVDDSTNCQAVVEVGGYDSNGNLFKFSVDGQVVHKFYLVSGGSTTTKFSFDGTNFSSDASATHLCRYQVNLPEEGNPEYILDSDNSVDCNADPGLATQPMGGGEYFFFEANGESVHEQTTEGFVSGSIILFNYTDSQGGGGSGGGQEGSYVCEVEFLEVGLSWHCPTDIKISSFFDEPEEEYEFTESCVSSGEVGSQQVGLKDFDFNFYYGDDYEGELFEGFSADFEGTKTFEVTQEQADLCNQLDGPTGDVGECIAIFSTDGVDWSCANHYMINWGWYDRLTDVDFMDECVTGGSLKSTDFQFMFGGRGIDFEGRNKDYDGVVPFTVPVEDNPCYAQELVLPELPYSGTVSDQTTRFEFEIPAGFNDTAYIVFRYPSDVYVEFEAEMESISGTDENGGFTILSSRYEAEQALLPYFDIYQYGPGEISWKSNVAAGSVVNDFPPTQFSYEFVNHEDYIFTLAETTKLTFTATAGQTCAVWEDYSQDFVDPYLVLRHSEALSKLRSNSDSGRGPGNCSASLLRSEQPAGTYILKAGDGRNSQTPITIGSNVELAKFVLEYQLNSQTVKGGESFEIQVPAGGSWFWAETITGQSNLRRFPESGGKQDIGCEDPDNDDSTDTGECIYTNTNIQNNDGTFSFESTYLDGYHDTKIVDGQEWQVHDVIGNSYFERFLPEGTYTLTTRKAEWSVVGLADVKYELKYGLGSYTSNKPEVINIVKVDTPPQSESQATVALPIAGLTESGNSHTSVSDQVTTMVCDANCVESLFTSAGLDDGVITVSVGGDSVQIAHGQPLAIFPVDASARSIKVAALSSDGTMSTILSTKIDRLSTEELADRRDSFVAVAPKSLIPTVAEKSDQAINVKASSSDDSCATCCNRLLRLVLILWLLLLIPILWILVIVRRRESEPSDV